MFLYTLPDTRHFTFQIYVYSIWKLLFLCITQTRNLILLFSYGLPIVSILLKIPFFPHWMKFLLCYQSYPHIYEFFPDSLFYLLVYNITLLFFLALHILFNLMITQVFIQLHSLKHLFDILIKTNL